MSKQPDGPDMHRGPIDVEVTEIGPESLDAGTEEGRRLGIYVGLGIPWFSIRVFVGRGEQFGLTAGFKVNLRLLPERRRQAPPWPGSAGGFDGWR